LHHLTPGLGLKAAYFLRIEDPQFELSDRCRGKRVLNKERFDLLVGSSAEVLDFSLFDAPLKLKNCLAELVGRGFRNVVVDMTCLPKRFFFAIVRLLLGDSRIANLVVTYSTPETYLPPGESLAFEPQDWAHLPMFQREEAPPTSSPLRIIVGVGFMPFHLPELLKQDYQDAKLRLIMPFPPGPPQFQRNWQFVHEIEKNHLIRDASQILRVDAYDVSGCFNYLSSEASEAPERTVFAPFGPKPHSLAMCLFAIRHGCDVFYTQPRNYHPDYSTGMRMIKGRPETHAYTIRLEGKDLYA
jgi:hypothetical protein